jgi:phosphohistidine swiveling domain-containing protein
MTGINKFSLLIEDSNVTPFVVSRLNYVMGERLKKHIKNPPSCIFEFANGNFKWYVSTSTWNDSGKEIILKLKTNPEKFVEFNHELRNRINSLKEFSSAFLSKDLSNLSLDDLWKIYLHGTELFEACYELGMLPTIADLGESFLTKELKNLLASYLSNVDEFFVKLTTPAEISGILKEEKELLELALNPHVLEDSKEIELHHQQYFWLTFGYEGPLYSMETIWAKIAALRENVVVSKERLESINHYALKNAKALSDLQKKLNLSDDVKLIFKIARDWLFLKEQRKEAFFACYAAFDRLAERMARKLKMSKLDVKYLNKHELDSAIHNNTFPQNIEQRIIHSVYIWENGDVVITGKALQIFLDTHLTHEAPIYNHEVKGQIAFMGTAKGQVKLIREIEDIGKMKKGDILVSPQTNPNLMPAIHLAAAIVTDTGGITCHAAIVAREMQIPCVVGTKNATRLLKDGDLVEVDANKGVVRKL